MGTKVRVLCKIAVDRVDYYPDQVVELPPGVAKAFADAGQVDPHKDAVAYAVKSLGAEVVAHPEPAAIEPVAPPPVE